MAQLRVAREDVDNVFALCGHKEDDFTRAIAWTLASCREFLASFLASLLSWRGSIETVEIDVHRHSRHLGTTDIELRLPGHFHVIVEAKLGIALPGEAQLRKYTKRLELVPEPIRLIVSLSECPKSFAEVNAVKSIDGIRVQHLTWEDLLALVTKANVKSRHMDKRTLRDLANFLRRYRIMQDINSNLVYVVSLRNDQPKGWDIRWIDIEAKYHKYFHPVARNWPRQPPNYVGFRYDGQLQAVHHVDRHEIIVNLADACPGIPSTPVAPHFLYHLGPAIRPARTVRTGKLYANARVWCHIDALLMARTVYDALEITKRREKSAKGRVSSC